MKFKFLTVVLTIGLCLILTASLEAQSLSSRFDVPFEFVVNGKTLPAGAYSVVCSGGGNSLIAIKSTNGGEAVYTLTHNGATTANNDQAKLVFHRYAGQYFLSAFARAESGVAVLQLPVTASEREASKNAALHAPDTVTLVAMR